MERLIGMFNRIGREQVDVMITMLKDWKGQVEVNGQLYNSIQDVVNKPSVGEIHIVLHTNAQKLVKNGDRAVQEPDKKEYMIKVKQYMTRKASPEFDFMAKWNNDVPMPMRIMTGTIDKQTPGMYHMTLHGAMYAERMCTCMKCGKELKNPVSQYFGIGPECGNHGYVNPFESEEELKAAVEAYKKTLQAITWSGWIIKSAIIEMEEV